MEAKDRRPENPCKRYVKVRADFELDGSIRPLLFRIWTAGKKCAAFLGAAKKNIGRKKP